MSLEQIIAYSAKLLTLTAAFFFLRKIYRNRIKKIILPKRILKEEWKEDKKFNELYQKNKRRELIKHQRMMREKQKHIRFYKEDLEIVEIVKPVGKWTKMIIMSNGLMQLLEQLIQRENKQKGFWELFIEAKASIRDKHKGKSR